MKGPLNSVSQWGRSLGVKLGPASFSQPMPPFSGRRIGTQRSGPNQSVCEGPRPRFPAERPKRPSSERKNRRLTKARAYTAGTFADRVFAKGLGERRPPCQGRKALGRALFLPTPGLAGFSRRLRDEGVPLDMQIECRSGTRVDRRGGPDGGPCDFRSSRS